MIRRHGGRLGRLNRISRACEKGGGAPPAPARAVTALARATGADGNLSLDASALETR
jgi:hypothetical protein